jgi:hypothetical protein
MYNEKEENFFQNHSHSASPSLAILQTQLVLDKKEIDVNKESNYEIKRKRKETPGNARSSL